MIDADLLGNEGVQELLAGLVRVGEVSEIQAGRVRVVFNDRDGVSSGLLQVLHRRTKGALDYDMPSVGEPVLCLMLPPDQVDGFVLGAVYDARQAPPTDDQSVRVIAGEDLRLGSVDASHKAPLGDVLLRVLTGLRELLASVQVQTPSGPGSLTATTTDYGSGLVPAIAAQMATDVADAVLLSQTVRVKE